MSNEGKISLLDVVDLVTKAKCGDAAAMSRLAEAARDKLFTYIYRLTLDYDLAQDLLQETLMEMVKSLKNLNRADRFWAWLFRTAMGKVQRHFREQEVRRAVQTSAITKERLSKFFSQNYDEVVNEMVCRELSEAIFEAMAKLKLGYRNVLVLRCFEQMSYAEIAGLMDCKELQARVLFFRAKHSLKQKLSRRGFDEGMLLTALGLFGLLTAPTKAVSAGGTVAAASLEVGSAAEVLGFLSTKLGIIIAAGVGAITVALVVKAFLLFVVLLFILLTGVCIELYSR